MTCAREEHISINESFLEEVADDVYLRMRDESRMRPDEQAHMIRSCVRRIRDARRLTDEQWDERARQSKLEIARYKRETCPTCGRYKSLLNGEKQ